VTNIAEIRKTIQELAEYAKEERPTGDPWLDALYDHAGTFAPKQPYYKFLWLLARSQGMKFGVETGTWRGFASSHMCAGSPGSTVVTIDIHREDKDAQRYVQSTIVPHFGGRLVYVNKWVADSVPDVQAIGLPIDLLYIDDWHIYEHAKRALDLFSPLMAKESLIFCDDLFDSAGTTEGMMRFWNEIEQPKFMLSGMHGWVPQGMVLWDW
jgi:predicted O-methyltransferase YrrM